MSILSSVKKMLGIEPEYTQFDADIIMHINTVFSILHQMGIGPEDGFTITDDSATWEDFIGDSNKLEMVKTYVYFKVRLMFDPPSSSFVLDSMNHQISELEWRLYTQVETPVLNR